MLFKSPVEKHCAEPFTGLPLHLFGTILADPPYHFKTFSAKGQGRSPSQHYSDLTIDEVAKLPVGDLAADNCWLFLWIPDPHVRQGLDLMEAWGFKFSGKGFTWAKLILSGKGWHLGLGFTTRKNSEFLLVGAVANRRSWRTICPS